MSKNSLLLINSLDIPYFEDLEEFSKAIGLSKKLIYILTNNTENYYHFKDIPKKSGKHRTIFIPSYTLKIVQKWILNNILNKLKPSDFAMAFRKSTTENRFDIKKNASYHANSLYGLSIDLCDFFPSISSNKVFRIFKSIGYNNTASTILTNLCTLDGSLPQGAVCSPALSNLICIILDKRLSGLCSKRGILYTRYADDMYFSCDNKGLLLKLLPIINTIINDEGFMINKDKLHFHTPKNKHQITGIIVDHSNEKNELKASKELKRKIRSEIFQCIMSGAYESSKHIKGEISYVCYIQKENTKSFKESIIKYINKVSKKVEYFPELVDAYNANFFYKEQEHLEYQNITKLELINDGMDIAEYEHLLFSTKNMIYQSRKDYINKKRIKDICEYKNWPKEIIDNALNVSNDVISDNESPF